MSNPFFHNHGPLKLKDILKTLNLDLNSFDEDMIITDIKDLINASKSEITFFHSKKYKDLALNTKASFCITSEFLADNLPNKCTPLIVDNVLVATSKVTEKFYPESINDNFDDSVIDIDNSSFRWRDYVDFQIFDSLLSNAIGFSDTQFTSTSVLTTQINSVKNTTVPKNLLYGTELIPQDPRDATGIDTTREFEIYPIHNIFLDEGIYNITQLLDTISNRLNTDDIINFDLDGLWDTHHIYRINTKFENVFENAKSVISSTDAQVHWKYIVFEHNKHQVEEARALAEQTGFTTFSTVKTSRDIFAPKTGAFVHSKKTKA